MLISKTYLNQYKKIISIITFKVNKYLLEKNILDNKTSIQPSFFLRLLSNKETFYSEIIIYQKNKKRILHEPILELKYIQKFILHTILYKMQEFYQLDESVTGYMKHKSILRNAEPHLNKIAIIKMDIKDFFPSITRSMIYNIFKKYNKFSYEYAYILSHLVTYKDFLPQGAPTSPFLANVCAKGIDYKINKLIEVINQKQNMNIAYTRYADDITISFDKKFNYDYIVNTVTGIILDEGFYPNFKKSKIIKNNHCQKVTGIVVNNNLPSIEKKEREKIKFILNIWEKYGVKDAIQIWNQHRFGRILLNDNLDVKITKFQEVVSGKIIYFNMVNPDQNKKLLEKFSALNSKLVFNEDFMYINDFNLDS